MVIAICQELVLRRFAPQHQFLGFKSKKWRSHFLLWDYGAGAIALAASRSTGKIKGVF
jgi:hypothetical protein